jgi:hypothetical protein
LVWQKVTEKKVLEAAKTESKNFLLVYASEKAMQFEPKPLPHPLEVRLSLLGIYFLLTYDRPSSGMTINASKPN